MNTPHVKPKGAEALPGPFREGDTLTHVDLNRIRDGLLRLEGRVEALEAQPLRAENPRPEPQEVDGFDEPTPPEPERRG